MRRIILDLFAGTGSATEVFRYADEWDVFRVEKEERFDAELHADILDLTVQDIEDLCGGRPHFIWASPPCQAFSVASIGHHWGGGKRAYQPKTEAAVHNQELVAHTLRLIAGLAPQAWVMENPRGVLRRLPVVRGLPNVTVTYCQYGDDRMKPTDLWGRFPSRWEPLPRCKNGDDCHVAAPRGAKTGTQGLKGAEERSRVPFLLGMSLFDAMPYDVEI